MACLIAGMAVACEPENLASSEPLSDDTATSAPTTDTTSTTDTTDTSTVTDTTPRVLCLAPDPIAVDPDPLCPRGTAALLDGRGYPSVAEAVTVAVDGDRVEVCPGLWPANLVIRAAITLTGRAGWKATVLDGGGVGPVVDAESAVIEGVTLACGESEREGGGAILRDATLRDARVTRNHARACGGIDAGASVVGPDVVVDDNTADGYGGGLCGGYVFDSTLSNNRASNGGGFDGMAFMTDVLVRGNTASGQGGGGRISCGWRAGCEAQLSGVSFEGNTAGEGGGLSANQEGGADQPITIADCLFQGNSADVGGGYADDGGTHYYSGPHVVRTVFSANSARVGGGMYAQSGNGYDVTFTDNLATEVGGGLYATGPSSFADTRFLRNVAPQGGAIALEWSTLGLYGDLGSGADDNSDDIFLVSAGATYADYGADVIVGCSDDDPAWCAVAPPPAEAAEPVVTAGTDTGTAGTRRSARRWPTRLPDRPWTCARETGPPTSC